MKTWKHIYIEILLMVFLIRNIKLVFLLTVLISTVYLNSIVAQKKILGSEREGLCSFYSNKFNGFKTSNGEQYDINLFTAAHKSLPFNTILAVFNLKTEKYVIVRINDRGPFRKSRLIDISKAAANELGIAREGITKVRIKILGFDGFQNLDPIDPIGDEAEVKNEHK